MEWKEEYDGEIHSFIYHMIKSSQKMQFNTNFLDKKIF